MSERKQTPDILASILGSETPAPDQFQPALDPTAIPPGPVSKPRKSASPKPRPESKTQTPLIAAWDYLIVSFKKHQGWRPAFINGKKIKDWENGPEMQDFLAQQGEEGWELACASSGETMYSQSDDYQLFFKRPKK